MNRKEKIGKCFYFPIQKIITSDFEAFRAIGHQMGNEIDRLNNNQKQKTENKLRFFQFSNQCFEALFYVIFIGYFLKCHLFQFRGINKLQIFP